MLLLASFALGGFGIVCGAYSQQCPRTAAISTGILGVACGAIVALKDRASETTRQWWSQMWKSLRTRSADLENGIAAAAPHLAPPPALWRSSPRADGTTRETAVPLEDLVSGHTTLSGEIERNVRAMLPTNDAPASASRPVLAVAESQDRSVALASWHPTLNPLLRPRSDLMYNMLYDPGIASAIGGTLLPWEQAQPVTKKPELVRMQIVVDFPHAATAPVHMRPTGLFIVESPRQKSLQVSELLRGIHTWLHGPAEREDWTRVTPEQREIATRAFYARAHTAEERARGVRRIDWFGEHTFFGGITWSDAPAEMWRLTLVPAAVAARDARGAFLKPADEEAAAADD